MKIVLKNDSDKPTYVKFEEGADLNINAGGSGEIEAEEDAEMSFMTDHINTKNIIRP